VKLENNPYRNIEELESLMKDSPNNTVLAWGDDWMTAESVKNGTVTYTYVGFGAKYMITVEFSYPSQYGFVFEELRGLIRCRFIEGGKWKSASRPARGRPGYGAPSCGIQDLYYEDHGLWLVLPDTFDEQADEEDRIVFSDSVNRGSARVIFTDISPEEADNLYDVFEVIAADKDVMLGDDYVRWHNDRGMFIGTVYGGRAALLEFPGEQSYYTYEAIYDELICHFVPTYYEDNPVAEAKQKAKEKEKDPSSGGEASDPEEYIDPAFVPGVIEKIVEEEVIPADTIETVIRKKVVEKERKEKKKTDPNASDPPSEPNDPLVYHTDADRIAFNSTVFDWADMSSSDRISLLDTIISVLDYNGYTSVSHKWVYGTAIIHSDVNEEIYNTYKKHPEQFEVLTGSSEQDFFPYFCSVVRLDPVPGYRARSESALPEPQWLETVRKEEGSANTVEDMIDWDEARRLLDEGEDLNDHDSYLKTENGAQYAGSGRSRIRTNVPDFVWTDYGIRIDAETVIEQEKDIAELYWFIFDSQEDPEEVWKTDPYERYPYLEMIGAPDFDSIGTVDAEDIGIYEGYSDEMSGVEAILPQGTYFLISDDGIWAVYDAVNDRLLDYGLLIEDTEFGMWYTYTAEGEPVSMWFWDFGLLSAGPYGFVQKIDR
jgi:hypothetical protein